MAKLRCAALVAGDQIIAVGISRAPVAANLQRRASHRLQSALLVSDMADDYDCGDDDWGDQATGLSARVLRTP